MGVPIKKASLARIIFVFSFDEKIGPFRLNQAQGKLVT